MISDKQRTLYLSRIGKFIRQNGHRILAENSELTARFFVSDDPVPFAERLEGSYQSIREGEQWGSAWQSAWFHLQGRVPAVWKGKPVVAHLDFNGEGLVFSEDGVPLQGLTNGSVFEKSFSRSLYPLFGSAGGGESVELWVEAAANSLFGVQRHPDPPPNGPERHGKYSGTVERIRLCTVDSELYELWLDMDLLFNLLQALPPESVRAARILKGLSDAVDQYADDPANAATVRRGLAGLLKNRADASALTAHAVGHAHIDTGWLWPVRETIRKSARTFASQIALIERYEDYVFGASQPAHYRMVKEHYPALYEKIRKAVADGRWEVQGGMWVEADCNIISGESMVRQILHGKNFFMDEFGVEVRNLWIPDVFGYSAAMPQIMKRAGIDFFLTQKLSWSQFNTFPYTTFRWRGIDGSEVLTHFPPENNYNSHLKPGAMRKAEENLQEKDVLNDLIVLFGVGDGGGGPTETMIEQGRRQRDLEGVPRLTFGRADEFFDSIAESAQQLPVWNGELYLELHRGTLTTQGRTKRGNRRLEQKLRETEYLLSCGPLDDYPHEPLDEIWKTLLLNQFHDIIPGSSIHWVYEVAEKEYNDSLAACQALQDAAAASLFAPESNSLVLMNTLAAPFTQPVRLPPGWDQALVDSQGEAVPAQREGDGTVVAAAALPPQAVKTLTATGPLPPFEAGSGLVLENERIRYELTPDAAILSARDKASGRDILAEGECGNLLTLYEDRPINWDAWDVDIFYESQVLETARGVRHEWISNGPVRQGIAFTLAVGDSEIRQNIYLSADSTRLDFVTDVDWQERHRMLRTAFPTRIRVDQASYDIQYGIARRNTHRNTSWDMAKFEVAAQKYADLSNNSRGVALLNDCKYGHKILDNVIDLNLLRAPTQPDPDADQGHHCFTYSLLPHNGTLIDSPVLDEAAQLNQPAAVFPGCRQADLRPPVAVSGEGCALAALKKAEKQDCLVVRIVETRGCETTAHVRLADPQARLVETTLMEWTDEQDFGSGNVEIELRPFDIRSFKILAPSGSR